MNFFWCDFKRSWSNARHYFGRIGIMNKFWRLIITVQNIDCKCCGCWEPTIWIYSSVLKYENTFSRLWNFWIMHWWQLLLQQGPQYVLKSNLSRWHDRHYVMLSTFRLHKTTDWTFQMRYYKSLKCNGCIVWVHPIPNTKFLQTSNFGNW